MAKLVYIQGAHGVGKSTLLQDALDFKSRRTAKFTEIARQLISSGVGHGLAAPKEDYFAYICRHVENFNSFIDERQGFDAFLGDRSIIDVLVYTRLCHGRDCRDSNYIERLCIAIFRMIRPHIAFLAYIPIEFSLVSDGVRDDSIAHQWEYDQELCKVLNELDCSWFTINGSREKRAAQLDALVGLHCQ